MTTIHEKIREDIAFALEEASQHIQKFFGTPSTRRNAMKNGNGGTLEDLEEDQVLKPIAFKTILETLLRLYVEEPNGGKIE